MFKRYRVPADPDHPGGGELEFFVHDRKTRSGFEHEAAMFGFPPHRLGVKYPSADDDKLFRLRFMRVSYANRTWEAWGGQVALQRLWEQLGEAKKDFPVFAGKCPFDWDEPDHEDVPDPDDLFGWFRTRR